MQNLKKLFALMLMIASVAFFSCNKDDDIESMPKEEAKTELNQLDTDVSKVMTEMMESEGLEAFETLSGLSGLFEGTKSTSSINIIEKLHKFSVPMTYGDGFKARKSTKSVKEDDPFDFNSHVGTWTWNETKEKWDKENTPTDKIIIKFPADTANMETNNAVLTISEFEDVKITEDGYFGLYSYYEPTDILADLKVDDTKLVEIDVTATWVTTGEDAGEPLTLDAKVYLYPFEFTGNIKNSTVSQSVDLAINYNDEKIVSAGIGATLESEKDSIPANINGYVQFYRVKVQANIDLKDLVEKMMSNNDLQTFEELNNAINEEIDAKVLVDGKKAADIIIEFSQDDNQEMDFEIFLVFEDGSKEDAVLYFEDLIADMEDFFTELEDFYDNW